MNLELQKPLAFFDLETTGKDVKTAEIVEIGIVKLMPDGTRQELHTYIKPKNPIPQEAIDIHGISNEMVEFAPYIEEIADVVYDFIQDSDLAGYNSNQYDIPLFSRVFYELGYIFPKKDQLAIDVCNIFKRNEGRTLKDAYRFYKREELEDAHKATVDVNATIEVFLVQTQMYKKLPKDIAGLAIYSNYDKKPTIDRDGKFDYNADGDVVFTFGQHSGKKCVDYKGYLDWMIKGDFSPEVKEICKAIKDGEYDRAVEDGN